MNLNNVIQTISNIRPLVKVIECDSPVGIDIKTNSDNPNLIILDGKITESSFEDAKKQIPNGGIILLTKANAKNTDFIERAKELYGEAYEVIVKNSMKKELFVTIGVVVIYIKGVIDDIEYPSESRLWYLYKTKATIAKNMLMHNFKALIKNVELEVLEEKPKRKRRTKAEMKEEAPE
jgi:hypothetical protein